MLGRALPLKNCRQSKYRRFQLWENPLWEGTLTRELGKQRKHQLSVLLLSYVQAFLFRWNGLRCRLKTTELLPDHIPVSLEIINALVWSRATQVALVSVK